MFHCHLGILKDRLSYFAYQLSARQIFAAYQRRSNLQLSPGVFTAPLIAYIFSHQLPRIQTKVQSLPFRSPN